MKKIHQLSNHIISKIAAGEVIERPVYAVKELVDNSLDAGADVVSIHIEESGLKKITVIDNGEGMSHEDVLECFKPHTTSKISEEEALAHIQTLGFRGEALASIAAISRMTIQSKTEEETAGTRVVLKDGNVEKIEPVGMPSGTQISIDYLFHSVPGRKKFLQSKQTEFRQSIDLIAHYALAYPSVHFTLTHNKKIIFDLPKTTDALHRIEKLLGKEIYQALIPVSFHDAYITISGYIAKPPLSTKTPRKQYLFVNNRQIRDRALSFKIKAAYGTLLEQSSYPICVLSLTMPYELIDVNVHPRKEYVRFSNQMAVFSALEQALSQVLAQQHITTRSDYWKADALFEGIALGDSDSVTNSSAGKLLKERKLPWELDRAIKPDFSSIIQLHNLYLVMPISSGFILIDQHAAHERIQYEQLLAEFTQEKKKANVFHFTKPGIFELNPSDNEILNEHLSLFQELGWGIEHFKGTSYLLRSLPVLFQDRNYVQIIHEMLEDLREDTQIKSIDALSKKMIAYLACRSAIKAGDKLTKKQAKELVEQLEKTPNNTTCPHGRPTKVVIDLEKIDRLFLRR
jgi:DNA mismatch repair protein MutL